MCQHTKKSVNDMALSLITKAQDNLDYIKNPLNMIDHQFPAKESDFMDTNQLLSGMMSQHFNSDQMSMLLKSGMQQEELLHANVTGRSQKSATDQHSNGAEKQILDMRNAIENDIKAYLEIMNNIRLVVLQTLANRWVQLGSTLDRQN